MMLVGPRGSSRYCEGHYRDDHAKHHDERRAKTLTGWHEISPKYSVAYQTLEQHSRGWCSPGRLSHFLILQGVDPDVCSSSSPAAEGIVQGDVQRAHQGLAQHDRRPGGGGFAQGSTTVGEVPRGSSTSTVYTGWPCSTPIPASARLPRHRHRHGLQQRSLGREVAHRQPVVSGLDRVRNGRRRGSSRQSSQSRKLSDRLVPISCADLAPRRSPNVSDRGVSGDSGSSSDPLPSSLWTAPQSTGRHRQLRRLCPVVQAFSSWETRWGETL